MERPSRILIIDDEEIVIDSCLAILEGAGYEIATAPDGTEGLKRAQESVPDLVLVDLMMPGISGFEVLEGMRGIDSTIVTIVITGYSTVESAVEAMKRGAFDFLPKPFTPDELRMIVLRGLERRRLILEATALRRERELLQQNFAAIISHELRSPLSAVQQNLFVLTAELDDKLDESQRGRFERLKGRIADLLKMIQSWLRAVSDPGGRLGEELSPISARSAIAKAVESVQPHATRKDIAIADSTPESLPPVLGDEAILTEALVNLVGNAVKYTRAGGKVAVAGKLAQHGGCGARVRTVLVENRPAKAVDGRFAHAGEDADHSPADVRAGLGEHRNQRPSGRPTDPRQGVGRPCDLRLGAGAFGWTAPEDLDEGRDGRQRQRVVSREDREPRRPLRENRGETTITSSPSATRGTRTTAAWTTSGCTGSPSTRSNGPPEPSGGMMPTTPTTNAHVGRFVTPLQVADIAAGLQTLAARANQQNIHIFVWLVGAPESFYQPAADQLAALAGGTGGSFLTFSGTESVPDLETYLEPLRPVYRLVYESQVSVAGPHQISAQVSLPEGSLVSPVQTFEVNLQPPIPELLHPPVVIDRSFTATATSRSRSSAGRA